VPDGGRTAKLSLTAEHVIGVSSFFGEKGTDTNNPAQRQASAEEPITARIRRRQEVSPGSGQAFEGLSDREPEQNAASASAEHTTMIPPISFRERIAMERQGKDHGPSLP
jgi:hypothetical protein